MLGIEIETDVVGGINEEIIGGYHEGEFDINGFGNYWKVEDDGSLDGNEPVEFISRKLEGKEEFFKALEDFKRSIRAETGLTLLHNSLEFNDSCGCHIHIGSRKGMFSQKIPFFLLKKMRKKFFKKVEKSQNLSNHTKDSVLRHYFRNYAVETTKRGYYRGSSGEFNVTSERGGKGLEWRSFNLLDVNSWGEFDEMFRIAWDCIEYLHDKIYNGYETNDFYVLKKPDIDRIKAEIPKDVNTRIIIDNNYYDEIDNNKVEEINLNISEV